MVSAEGSSRLRSLVHDSMATSYRTGSLVLMVSIVSETEPTDSDWFIFKGRFLVTLFCVTILRASVFRGASGFGSGERRSDVCVCVCVWWRDGMGVS